MSGKMLVAITGYDTYEILGLIGEDSQLAIEAVVTKWLNTVREPYDALMRRGNITDAECETDACRYGSDLSGYFAKFHPEIAFEPVMALEINEYGDGTRRRVLGGKDNEPE